MSKTPKQILDSKSATAKQRAEAIREWARQFKPIPMTVDRWGNIHATSDTTCRIKLGKGSVRREYKNFSGQWYRAASAPYSKVKISDSGRLRGLT